MDERDLGYAVSPFFVPQIMRRIEDETMQTINQDSKRNIVKETFKW